MQQIQFCCYVMVAAAIALAITSLTGRKVALDFKSNMKIVFDEFLPQWNYTAKPELHVI
jgi:phenolic acid decarboxylase